MHPSLKNIVLIFSFLWITMVLHSQSNTDSLKKELAFLPNDTNSILKILQEAYKYKDVDYNIFLELVNVAEKKAIAINNASWLCKVYLWKGISYLELSNSVEASKNLSMAKILAEKIQNKTLIISVNVELGAMYELNGEINEALKYYNESLEMSSSLHDLRTKGIILNRISGIYYKKLEFKRSIDLLRQSCQIMASIHDTNNLIPGLGNLALYFCHAGELDSADHYLAETEKIIEHYPYNNPYYLAGFYEIQGRIYLTHQKYALALKSYDLCIKYSTEMSTPAMIYESYHQIADIHEKTGNYRQALRYYQLYAELLDSVVSHDNFIKAINIQNMYEDKKKENELLRMNNEAEAKQIQIQLMNREKKDLINYVVLLLSVSVLFICLLGMLIWHIKSRQKEIRLLKQKNRAIEEQTKELGNSELLIAKFQFQMNPHFVFNALHNIQGLIMDNENTRAEAQIQRLASLMRNTYSNAEKDYITIEDEITYLKTYFQFESNIQNNIEFKISVENGLEDALIPPMIIQPLVENSIKHAHLDKVTHPYIKVDIIKKDRLLNISVKDNGMGISTLNPKILHDSHSMSILQSRIALLFQNSSAQIVAPLLSIQSVPEIPVGTCVKFNLPLNHLF
jgi:tetratricopeptide (TPR) repeat protein